MPLELGIFLGAKKYGGAKHATKCCLILDREPFRYQIFCSDIAGQDIRAHRNDAGEAIHAVRNWLRITHPGLTIPGAQRMKARYLEFRRELPAMAKRANLAVPELSFLDYRIQVVSWLDENSW
jgi:hypothetical protein